MTPPHASGETQHPRSRARRGPPLSVVAPLLLTAVLTWKLAALRPALAPGFYLIALLWALAYGVFLYLAYRAFPETLWAGSALATLLTGWSALTMALTHPGYGLRHAGTLLLAVLTVYGLTIALRTARLHFFHPGVLQGAYAFTLALLALTLVIGVHPGGQRVRLWLGCCGVYFQPAAWHKVTTIGYLAWGLTRARNRRWLVGLALTPVLLALQGDLGNLALFFALTGIMALRHPGYRQLLLGTEAGLVALAGAVLWQHPRVQSRLLAWLNPQADPLGAGYQILKALEAIQRGGWTGRGPLLVTPHGVPLAYTDMFYAAVADTWGWLGAAVLLGGLLLVVYWAFVVALRAGVTPPGRIAWGLAWWWSLQTFLVVGGTLRLLPFTGMPIPFAAYGGSELTAAYLGLTLLMAGWHHPGPEPPPEEVRALRLAVQVVTALFFLLLAAHAMWLMLGDLG